LSYGLLISALGKIVSVICVTLQVSVNKKNTDWLNQCFLLLLLTDTADNRRYNILETRQSPDSSIHRNPNFDNP